jgi:hypothetical protein
LHYPTRLVGRHEKQRHEDLAHVLALDGNIECGLRSRNCTILPSITSSFDSSYVAVKEWCAVTAPAASALPLNTKANIKFFMSFLRMLQTCLWQVQQISDCDKDLCSL